MFIGGMIYSLKTVRSNFQALFRGIANLFSESSYSGSIMYYIALHCGSSNPDCVENALSMSTILFSNLVLGLGLRILVCGLKILAIPI